MLDHEPDGTNRINRLKIDGNVWVDGAKNSDYKQAELTRDRDDRLMSISFRDGCGFEDFFDPTNTLLECAFPEGTIEHPDRIPDKIPLPGRQEGWANHLARNSYPIIPDQLYNEHLLLDESSYSDRMLESSITTDLNSAHTIYASEMLEQGVNGIEIEHCGNKRTFSFNDILYFVVTEDQIVFHLEDSDGQHQTATYANARISQTRTF